MLGSSPLPSMTPFVILAFACFLASALLTYLVRNLASKRKWLAHPRTDRWHQAPTALFGGVAIYLVFVGGLLATRPLSRSAVGLLLLSSMMVITGLIDGA